MTAHPGHLGPRILGISAYFHDSSAALVSDGELVAAAAEERFTRQKHDSNFPARAIHFCLEQGGITASDLDSVVFYEEPHLKFTRVLASTLATFPRSPGCFVGAMKEWLGNKLWLQYQVSRELGVDIRKVTFVPHHLSHQAQAFLSSPFRDAAVLTLDAVGEWICTSIAHAIRGDKAPIKTLESLPYPHSLGLAYAAFSAFLGFRPNDGEANTMALAAYGRPRFANEVRQIIRVDDTGLYSLSDGFFRLLSSGSDLFTAEFIRLFGIPRDFHRSLPFDSIDDLFASGHVDEYDVRYADVAASVQLVLEEAVLALARRARRLTGSRNLAMAGGVALNAVSNTKVIEGAGFEEVFIPWDPGDGGAALGAALLEHLRITGSCPRGPVSPWQGKQFDSRSFEGLVRSVNPEEWSTHVMDGCAGIEEGGLSCERTTSADQVIQCAVDDLLSGRIVGWVQGRFEVGPRALGNRSILADPADIATVRRLSSFVKERASFRPYALSICREDAPEVFGFDDRIPLCAKWMQMVKRVRPEVESLVRGAVHYDRTTRLQVCSEDENPRFHRLLTAFGKRRGIGALLNTSFNESGYPMLASPSEALIMFARTELDTLIVDDLIVRKSRRGGAYAITSSSNELALGTSTRAVIND